MPNFSQLIIYVALLFKTCGDDGDGAKSKPTKPSSAPQIESPQTPKTTQTNIREPGSFIRQIRPSDSQESEFYSGSLLNDSCKSVAMDDTGIYCAGYTEGNLGDLNAGNSWFSKDAIVAKFSKDGAPLWISHIGKQYEEVGVFAGSSESCNSIALFDDGVYCVGTTQSSLRGDVSDSNGDGFVFKLSKDEGSLQWIKQFNQDFLPETSPTDHYDVFTSVVVDESGIYIGGYTDSDIAEVNGDNNNSSDAFLVKLTEDNTDPLRAQISINWMRQIGLGSEGALGAGATSGRDLCNAIAMHGDFLYCTGNTKGNLGETNGSSNKNDIFVLKVAKTTGAVEYLFQIGENSESTDGATESDDYSYAIAVDDDGIYLAGSTKGNLGETKSGGGTTTDAFILKLTEGNSGDPSAAGVEIDWITHIGNTALSTSSNVDNHTGDASFNDQCNSIAINETNVYCAGDTSSDLSGRGVNGADSFIMKVSKTNGQLENIISISNDPGVVDSSNLSNDYGNAIAVDETSIVVAGYTKSNLGDKAQWDDIYLAQFNLNTDAQEKIIQMGENNKFLSNSAGFIASGYDDLCEAIAIDNDAIYCAGETYGSFSDFNDDGKSADLLLVKISKNTHEIIWTKQLGRSFEEDLSQKEGCVSIALDENSIYCGGYTESRLSEDVIGRRNPFLVSFSKENGNMNWIKNFGENYYAVADNPWNSCESLIVDDTSLYCGFYTSYWFNGATSDNFATDGVIIKVNKNTGELQWSKQLGVEFQAEVVSKMPVPGIIDGLDLSRLHLGEDRFYAIAQDETAIYAAGQTDGEFAENVAGRQDILVVKFSKEDAGVLWIKQIGLETLEGLFGEGRGHGSQEEFVSDMVFYDGNLYLAGYTSGDFSEVSGGSRDAFVVKISEDKSNPSAPAPVVQWIKQLGLETLGDITSSDDMGTSISVDESGIYLGGHTKGSLGEEGSGNYSPFIAKINEVSSWNGKVIPVVNQIWQVGEENSLVEGSSTENGYCNSMAIDDSYLYCGGRTLNNYMGEKNGKHDIFIWGLLKE